MTGDMFTMSDVLAGAYPKAPAAESAQLGVTQTTPIMSL